MTGCHRRFDATPRQFLCPVSLFLRFLSLLFYYDSQLSASGRGFYITAPPALLAAAPMMEVDVGEHTHTRS